MKQKIITIAIILVLFLIPFSASIGAVIYPGSLEVYINDEKKECVVSYYENFMYKKPGEEWRYLGEYGYYEKIKECKDSTILNIKNITEPNVWYYFNFVIKAILFLMLWGLYIFLVKFIINHSIVYTVLIILYSLVNLVLTNLFLSFSEPITHLLYSFF